MSRTVNQEGYVVPPNPEYLEFKTSDGNASRWPAASATTRIVDNEGSVNYFEHLPLEHPQNIKWRYEVGDALARALKMPGMFVVVSELEPDPFLQLVQIIC